MLFDTCVDIEAIGLKCFQLMYPVWLPKFAMCIIASAGFNYNDFNIINAMIRVVKMDSHRVEFFSFYRGNMVGKAETQFGLCLPYILYTTSFTWDYIYNIGCVTLGFSSDCVGETSTVAFHLLSRFEIQTGFASRAVTLWAPLWWFLISDIKVTVGARESSPNQYITEVTGATESNQRGLRDGWA